ncbi:hypothetical protein ACIOWG_23155 [Streptomyces sp. NPDC087658]|uniref:hypothetical protein n=1 Tax=Streptomyces sp. NPDC087658 TaxID=3365800 RepID=UPI00381FE2E4
MTMLLSDEVDRIRDLALQLSKYEHEDSSKVWQYYFTVAVEDEIREPVKKFEILDSIWADLEYPDAMTCIIYPKEGYPSHIYPELGEKSLSIFLARWKGDLEKRNFGRISPITAPPDRV